MTFTPPKTEADWMKLAKNSGFATLALFFACWLFSATGFAIFFGSIAFSIAMSAWGMAVEVRDATGSEAG